MTSQNTRWSQAFPWLSTRRAGRAEEPDWSQPIGSLESGQDDEVLDALVGIAVESQRGWTFGELFPYVPLALEVRTLDLDVRSENVLSRQDLHTFGDLATLTVPNLLAARAAGVTTVQRILRGLALANATNVSEPASEPPEEIVRRQIAGVESKLRPPAIAELIRNFTILAEWRSAQRVLTPLLDPDLFRGTVPERIAQAGSEILTLLANDILIEAEARSAADVIEGRIGELSEREQEILTGRLLQVPPRTLDNLGVTLGVTRERVRQIESSLLAKVSGWLDDDTELGLLAAAVRHRIGRLMSVAALTESIPELSHQIGSTGKPAWYVLDKFDEGFESDGEWAAIPSLQSVASETGIRFDQVSLAPGLARRDALVELATEWGMSTDSMASWLDHLGYRTFLDHYIAPSEKSLPDVAYLYLRAAEEAATPEEILLGLSSDRSINSLKNALAADRRFQRVGAKTWGLTEWGAREYVSIRSAIGKVLEDAGEVTIDALIANLTEDFQVSPTSIATYASTWPFETVNGVVRLAKQPPVSRRSLSQTKHVYKRDSGSIALKLLVNSEHLRGSGFPIPTSLATAVGLPPGEKIQLAAPGRMITLSWVTAQPSFGSIRAQLLELDAVLGEHVFLEFDLEKASIRKADVSASTPSQAALAMIGLPGQDFSQSLFGRAIGLGDSSSWPSIVHAFRDRGESDIADLLISAVGPNEVFDPELAPMSNSRFSIVAISDLTDE